MSNVMINRRIQDRRQKLNLTQLELAELSGLSQSQISRYEQDANEPTADALIALARALDVSTDYLLGLMDDPRPPPMSASELTALESEVISLVRGMSEDQARQALSMLKILLH